LPVFVLAQAIGPRFPYPQLPPANWNVTVTVTWDEVQSVPFRVFINMPYANVTVNTGHYCSGGQCDRNAPHFFAGARPEPRDSGLQRNADLLDRRNPFVPGHAVPKQDSASYAPAIEKD